MTAKLPRQPLPHSGVVQLHHATCRLRCPLRDQHLLWRANSSVAVAPLLHNPDDVGELRRCGRCGAEEPKDADREWSVVVCFRT